MADIGLSFWLTQWDWEPSIVVGTALIVGLYLYALNSLRKRYYPEEQVKTGQTVAFLLGMFIMFLALVSPLDELGDSYLFSAHMLQHLCLTMVGPPLLLIGTPAWMVKPLLRNRAVFLIAKFFTYPAIAFFLFNADFWLWHAPPLYNATLENQSIHILEHLTFIVFAVLNWWPIYSPLEEGLPRLSPGGRILYLFLSGMPMVALGAGLTFCSAPLRSIPGCSTYLGPFGSDRPTVGWTHHVGTGEHCLHCGREHHLYSLDAEAGGQANAGRSELDAAQSEATIL